MNYNYTFLALVTLLISGQTHTMGILGTPAGRKACAERMKERSKIIKIYKPLRKEKTTYFHNQNTFIRNCTSWHEGLSYIKRMFREDSSNRNLFSYLYNLRMISEEELAKLFEGKPQHLLCNNENEQRTSDSSEIEKHGQNTGETLKFNGN